MAGESDDGGETATADPSTQPTAEAHVPKRTLGRYEIESVLGAGGMGVVYAAFDPELERRVALKVLPDAKRGQTARERLLREARAMARLNHPNVVRVYEVDSADGHDFVAMELIEGGSLADWLRAERRSATAILDAFLAAGRGLVAAHAAGVIHRDFKPANVLCANDGRILVTDFGLARDVEPSAGDAIDPADRPSAPPPRASPLSGLTETGSILGTPAYMAPEQREGLAVGPAADQFAFCVALWEALAGARPYRGNIEEILAALERGPAGLDASPLPRRLRTPLLRGLEPDPAKRWPTMKALLGHIAPPLRRWLVPAALACAALLSLGAIALVLAMREDAAPCTPSLLDPDRVWPAGSSAKLAAQGGRGVARLLDNDLASWKKTRAQACKAEPKQREATLACLDGVLARFDAVVHSAEAAASKEIDPEDLIEPAVCAHSPAPRLPRTVSPEWREVVTVAMQEIEKQRTFDAALIAELEKHAKLEPCARALVYFVQAKTDGYPAQRITALGQAELFADQCGDDHMVATILVYAAAAQVQTGADTASATTKRAEIAVERAPTSDLLARLDLVRMIEARAANRLDDAIAHGELAHVKLSTRGCVSCAVRAGLHAIDYRATRAAPADLIEIPKRLDRYHDQVVEALGADNDNAWFVESWRASWLWRLGKLDEAHRVIDSIRTSAPQSKPRSVTGRVLDAQGQPVAGAKVTAGVGLFGDALRAAVWFDAGEYVRDTVTDASGAFAIADASPDATVIAEQGTRRSTPAAIADRVELVLHETSRLAGSVDLGTARAHTTVVAAADPAVPDSIPYRTIAPVHSDGSFELSGVPRKELRLDAAVREAGASSAAHIEINVDRPVITGIELSLAGPRRSVHVLVRSTVRMAVPAANIAVYAGEVTSSNLREMKRRETITTAVPRPLDLAKVPLEVRRLARRDDLYAKLDRVPAELASVCATGLSRADDYDEELETNIEQQAERIEVRCVTVAAGTSVVVVEVPPFPRFE